MNPQKKLGTWNFVPVLSLKERSRHNGRSAEGIGVTPIRGRPIIDTGRKRRWLERRGGKEKEERSVHTQSNSRIWFCYSVNYTPWTWASLQSTRVMRIIALRFLARRHFREGGERGGPRLIFTLPYELARFSTRFVGLIRAALLFALSPRQIFVEKFRATIKTIVQVCVCVCVCMNAWRMKFDEESS